MRAMTYEKNFTNRIVVKKLEEILYNKINVLDKGFIRVIDYMGDDSSIVQSARVSYGKGTKTISQDKGLINYLMRHSHTTPFEMCEIKFHIKLPIFVARQWIRHRTANVNEYSARYSIVNDEFYFPDHKNIAYQSDLNAQGRGEELSKTKAEEFISKLENNVSRCYEDYQTFLDEGISRELSRITLPLNCYTEWYWKIDLHNLLHFLKLRADSHSQYEIREYAKKIEDIVKDWVPLTYEAFEEYVKHSFTLSKKGLDFIRKNLNKEVKDPEEFGIGKREAKEIMEAIEE
jgi:thymidylate synthase (FAD)